MAERKTLLIPSLLDDWFPLLQYAFTSEEWEPVLLTEDDPHLAELGLKYFHNELCYPVFLVAGQVLSALRSGRYDPARCGVLFGQAGDECRGSCGIRLLRRVLDRLGYRKILCVQPFACLPGHIFGKGQYAALQRKLPGARLVSVDYDASTGEGTVLSRIRMLLDEELDPELL